MGNGAATLSGVRLRLRTGIGRRGLRVWLGYPLPRAATVLKSYSAGFSVLHQTIQDGSDGRHGVFVAGQHGRQLLLDLLAHVARAQGAVRLHENPSARLGEARLTPVVLAVDQLQ